MHFAQITMKSFRPICVNYFVVIVVFKKKKRKKKKVCKVTCLCTKDADGLANGVDLIRLLLKEQSYMYLGVPRPVCPCSHGNFYKHINHLMIKPTK